MEHFTNLTASTAVCLVVFPILFTIIKRLYFHPLASYPGPLLAASTRWYRAYYDIVMDGGWAEHLAQLHSIYGTIVRIGPNEVHFSEPRAYNDIYGMGTKHQKQPEMYNCLSAGLSVFAICDHQEAMQRRNLIGPFFSRRAVLDSQATVQAKVDLLISRLLEYQHAKKLANLDMAFRAVSLDILTSYCFGKSSNALDSENFHSEGLVAMDQSLPMIWVFKHFPIVGTFLLGIPESLTSILRPSSKGILDERKQMYTQIDEILKDPTSSQNIDYESIYHFLTSQPYNPKLPPVTRQWLFDEGLYMYFAGSDTVANTCTVAAYHILSDKHVYDTLTASLKLAWPDKDVPVSYETLEKLPYLTAVIKESLRMAHGVVTPLPRIVGPTNSQISGVTVPAGVREIYYCPKTTDPMPVQQTVVSMGAMMMHRNPDIFPDPSNFDPSRWLQDDSNELEKYLVSFSKGPRSCLGINLAWCGLYMILGTVFRKLDLVPDNASFGNTASFREYLVPVHRDRHFHTYVQATAD